MIKILVFTHGVTGNVEEYEQKNNIILHFITGCCLKNRPLGATVEAG